MLKWHWLNSTQKKLAFGLLIWCHVRNGCTVAHRHTVSAFTKELKVSTNHALFTHQNTIDYLRLTGREDAQVALVEQYAKEIGLWASDIWCHVRNGCTVAHRHTVSAFTKELKVSTNHALFRLRS
jgi:hypothetical protein